MALVPLILAAADATKDVPAAPVLIIMLLGVLVAIAGHLYGSYTVVGMGIFLVFLATAAMIVGGFLAYQQDDPDPRPQNNPREPNF
jgi:formate hydrogenlyase subunit 3/multisubunit Na+/H+ antiporter MnhD subunit